VESGMTANNLSSKLSSLRGNPGKGCKGAPFGGYQKKKRPTLLANPIKKGTGEGKKNYQTRSGRGLPPKEQQAAKEISKTKDCLRGLGSKTQTLGVVSGKGKKNFQFL